MNLSRPDRPQRLDALAAEYALGTMPARARLRLARAAGSDRVIAAALRDWETRLAPLAEGVAPVTPPPRVWAAIVPGLASQMRRCRRSIPWWARVTFWRSFALTSFAIAMAFGVTLFLPGPRRRNNPSSPCLPVPTPSPC